MSVSAVLYPRWPPWLKIEISSNGQNCSILSQKMLKFELYKHNDELFNIYYEIFLWTLNFCLFWPIMQIRKKGGWNLKKIFSETTEPISTKLCWNDPWVVPFQNCDRQCRLVSKMATITIKIEISSNGQNCSILSRKCPNLNCIILMSFLTYITGFFMNFELLPILTDYAN